MKSGEKGHKNVSTAILVFNGTNGAGGDYHLPPMTP